MLKLEDSLWPGRRHAHMMFGILYFRQAAFRTAFVVQFGI